MTRIGLLFAALLALAFPGEALAQCNGQFLAGAACGNAGASQAPPGPATLSSLLDRNFGAPSAAGTMLNRGMSLWSATTTPTLGASGTLGSLSFGNATSGLVTLQPVTGALGTVTASLPANTGTLAELNLAQTWTAGQVYGAATGGNQGVGTINATGLYVNGVAVITAGTSSPGGSNGNVQYNNAGAFGGLTDTQLTARIALATASVSGAVPAYPNNTTTFLRGDLSYATLNFAAVGGTLGCAQLPALTGDVTNSSCAMTLATVNSNVGSFGSSTFIPTFTVNGKGLITAAGQTALTYDAGNLTGTTLAAGVVTSSLTSVGTLGAGAASTGFTVQATNVTWTGTVPVANLPVATSSTNGILHPDNSSIMISGGVISAPGTGGGTVSSCAQYSVGAWTGAGMTTTINCVAPAANAILVTNGSDVPSLGTALPTGTGINATNMTWSGTVPGSNMQQVNLAASGNGGVTGSLPLSNLASISADNVVGNFTGSSAAPSSQALPSCSTVFGALNYSTSSHTIGCNTLSQPFTFENCSLAASVSGNNLTVALKDNAGSDPSASSPCVVWFRNGTAATGSWVQRAVTVATSFVANAGSTFGATNTSATCLAASSCPFRLWVVAIDTGSTAVLGIVDLTNASGVRPLNESASVTSTACNACITATALGTVYSTASQTGSIRILGYLEWGSGLATAGTYASGPTVIQSLSPGTRKPGEVVQIVYASTTTANTVSSATPSSFLSSAITPTSSANPVLVRGDGTANASAGINTGNIILWHGTTSGTKLTVYENFNGAGGGVSQNFPIEFLDTPGTTSSQTYTLSNNGDGTNTLTACPHTTTGLAYCTLKMSEIMG